MRLRRGLKVSLHDEILFQRAADLAMFGEHHRVRVGAILAKGVTTFKTGFNRSRNPVENVPYGEATIHAERQVIEGVAKSNCTLYVARLGLSGSLMTSWPCSECMEHIVACECVGKICFYDGQALVKVRL